MLLRRRSTGFAKQHLTGVQLVGDMCRGRLEGTKVGSTEMTLFPAAMIAGDFVADIGSAGSICLLIQCSLPCALFAPGPCELVLRGGTNAEMAPQIDYLQLVLKPILLRFGVNFDLDIRMRGYFPRGGGEVVVRTLPVLSFSPIVLDDPGNLVEIRGRAFVAGSLPLHIATKMAKVATKLLEGWYPGVKVHVEVVSEFQTVGTGTGIILVCDPRFRQKQPIFTLSYFKKLQVGETSTGCFFGGSALGRRGVRAEVVAEEAAKMLHADIDTGACVDRYSQDQIIIFMALAVCSVCPLASSLALGQLTFFCVSQSSGRP